MKARLLTPGPTPVPEDTLLDMARQVYYHRSPQFRQILADALGLHVAALAYRNVNAVEADLRRAGSQRIALQELQMFGKNRHLELAGRGLIFGCAGGIAASVKRRARGEQRAAGERIIGLLHNSLVLH